LARLFKWGNSSFLALKEGINMKKKRRIHDGIAGAVVTVGVILGYFSSPLWFLLPGLLGVVLIQSAFTGFCPVYYVLDKTCNED